MNALYFSEDGWGNPQAETAEVNSCSVAVTLLDPSEPADPPGVTAAVLPEEPDELLDALAPVEELVTLFVELFATLAPVDEVVALLVELVVADTAFLMGEAASLTGVEDGICVELTLEEESDAEVFF